MRTAQVIDGGTMSLYLNGELLDSATFGSPVSLPDSGQDLQIAGDDGDFAGAIDEVAFYNRALTQEAIRLHYGEHQVYDYDNLYRLTDATYGNGNGVEYTYDGVGNRLTMVTGAGTTEYAHDAADRITSVTPPGESPITYTWDDDGTLTARGSDSFTWDAAERLASATVGSATTFSYNGDGLRESKTFASNTTTITWDVNRSISQVLDDETFQYLYGIGRIAQVSSGDTHYYLADGLGSTMALTDDVGNVVNTYDYDAFGSLRGSTGSQANDFTFTGEQVDRSTGLQYLRARYYDTESGAFVSADPLAQSTSWDGHSFVYAANTPPNATDPAGLDPEPVGTPESPEDSRRPEPEPLPLPITPEDRTRCQLNFEICLFQVGPMEALRNRALLRANNINRICDDVFQMCINSGRENPGAAFFDWDEAKLRMRAVRSSLGPSAVTRAINAITPPKPGSGGLLNPKEGGFRMPCGF